MNDFIESHKDLIDDKKAHENKYIDGIGPATSGSVESLPFIEIEQVETNEQVNYIISVLKDSKDDSDFNKNNFFKEKTDAAQNQELISKLNKRERWDANSEATIYLVDWLIKDKELIARYEKSITEIITFAVNNNYRYKSLIKSYLEAKLANSKTLFSYNDEMLLKALVERATREEDYCDYVFKYLFEEVKTDLLDKRYVDIVNKTSGAINLVALMNTDLGRYYNVIKSIPKDIIKNHFRKDVVSSIEEQHDSFKDYLMGMFYYLFKFASEDKAGLNCFIGYSHNFTISYFNKQMIKYFKEAAVAAFANVDDEYIFNNVATVVLMASSPDELSTAGTYFNMHINHLVEKVISTYILETNISEKTFTMWLSYLAQQESTQTLM